MDKRMTKHGSMRYSFPLGARNPSEVLRVFEHGHKLSFHICLRGYDVPVDIVTTVHKFLFDNKIIREAEVPSWY